MKCDELLKILKKNGWYEEQQKGSHKILRNTGSKEAIVFPYHRGKEIPTWNLQPNIKTSRFTKKEYTLIIEQNTDGFWGQIVEYPHVFTSGETLDELKHNSREAMDLYLTSIGETTEEEVDFKLLVDLQEILQDE